MGKKREGMQRMLVIINKLKGPQQYVPRKELENYVTHRMEERDGTPRACARRLAGLCRTCPWCAVTGSWGASWSPWVRTPTAWKTWARALKRAWTCCGRRDSAALPCTSSTSPFCCRWNKGVTLGFLLLVGIRP